MTKKKPRHWWWQVILPNKTISLAGEETSMKGLFDLSNEKGGSFTRVTLRTEEQTYASYSRRSDSLRAQSYPQLFFTTRDGWTFPVPDEAFIQRSPETTEESRW